MGNSRAFFLAESKAAELTEASASNWTYKALLDVEYRQNTGHERYTLHAYDMNDDYVGPWVGGRAFESKG